MKRKRRKAAKHIRAKAQVYLLSTQLCDRSSVFVAEFEELGLSTSIPSVSSVVERGRWTLY